MMKCSGDNRGLVLAENESVSQMGVQRVQQGTEVAESDRMEESRDFVDDITAIMFGRSKALPGIGEKVEM